MKNCYVINGERARSILRQRKMTQKYVAEKLGVSSKTIKRWLDGEHGPNWIQIQAVANILNVGFNDIAEEADGWTD